jgi:hypothetical protein
VSEVYSFLDALGSTKVPDSTISHKALLNSIKSTESRVSTKVLESVTEKSHTTPKTMTAFTKQPTPEMHQALQTAQTKPQSSVSEDRIDHEFLAGMRAMNLQEMTVPTPTLDKSLRM